MNRADPTTAETNFLSATDRELSVEEVAEIQALDATMAVTETPTAPNVETSETARPEIQPTKIPFPLPRRPVSGRYRSGSFGFQLELRVDVDGRRPMRKVSGDFYQVSGSTVSYFGSFVVDAPVLTVLPNM